MAIEQKPNLQQIMSAAGGKVALLGAKPAQPVLQGRRCNNCFYNPSGNVCQRWPMEISLLLIPQQVPHPQILGKVETQLVEKRNAEVRMTPPGYCCGEHRYELEVREWSWNDQPPAPAKPLDVSSANIDVV